MIPSCSEEKLRVWEPDASANLLARKFGCSQLMASLLWMRGVSLDSSEESRDGWVVPDLVRWLDRADLGGDSRKACDLWSAIDEGSNVVVYGDYDVDGIAATTFMMELKA